MLHWIAWQLVRDPTTRILYVAHTATFATKQSRTARRLARMAEVEISEEAAKADEWETSAGGGLVARGIDGDYTGRGFDVIIVDDPIKGHKAAESAHQREVLWSAFTIDIFSRLEPEASIVVVHTRWHVDDLIGRLIKSSTLGFEYLNIQAIAENDNDPLKRQLGEALWPQRWPVKALEERRNIVGEHAWAALFQGVPRPRGNKVFGEPHFYDVLPDTGYRVGYGVDLAYTEKTSADYSVLIRGYVVQEKLADGKTRKRLYVTHAWRQQVEPTVFVETIKAARRDKPGPVLWYASGTEKGTALFFRKEGITLAVRNANSDKFQRAQPVAAAWNRGDVLVPSWAPDWMHVFLDELSNFTGIKDVNDDQVDACAALHDLLMTTGSGSGATADDSSEYRMVA